MFKEHIFDHISLIDEAYFELVLNTFAIKDVILLF